MSFGHDPELEDAAQEVKTFSVFTRTWWKEATAPGWPNNLEPQAGKRNYAGHPQEVSEVEAREYCKRWNATHPRGRYSLKAEYEGDE